jgi:hypothetical protein
MELAFIESLVIVSDLWVLPQVSASLRLISLNQAEWRIKYAEEPSLCQTSTEINVRGGMKDDGAGYKPEEPGRLQAVAGRQQLPAAAAVN